MPESSKTQDKHLRKLQHRLYWSNHFTEQIEEFATATKEKLRISENKVALHKRLRKADEEDRKERYFAEKEDHLAELAAQAQHYVDEERRAYRRARIVSIACATAGASGAGIAVALFNVL